MQVCFLAILICRYRSNFVSHWELFNSWRKEWMSQSEEQPWSCQHPCPNPCKKNGNLSFFMSLGGCLLSCWYFGLVRCCHSLVSLSKYRKLVALVSIFIGLEETTDVSRSVLFHLSPPFHSQIAPVQALRISAASCVQQQRTLSLVPSLSSVKQNLFSSAFCCWLGLPKAISKLK